MKEVSRADINLKLAYEQRKDNPNKQILEVIYKALSKMYKQEKMHKRFSFYVLLSEKDYDLLFETQKEKNATERNRIN